MLKSDVGTNPWTIQVLFYTNIKVLFYFISFSLSGSNLMSISLLLFLRQSLSLTLVFAKESGKKPTSKHQGSEVSIFPAVGIPLSATLTWHFLHRLWIWTQNLKEFFDGTSSWPLVLMNEVEFAISSFRRGWLDIIVKKFTSSNIFLQVV